MNFTYNVTSESLLLKQYLGLDFDISAVNDHRLLFYNLLAFMPPFDLLSIHFNFFKSNKRLLVFIEFFCF